MLMDRIISLNPRMKDILIARLLCGLNMREVGKHYGVSRERIRQVLEKSRDEIDLSYPDIFWGRRRFFSGFCVEELFSLSRELFRKEQDLKLIFGDVAFLKTSRRKVWDMIIDYYGGNFDLYKNDQLIKQIYGLIDQYDRWRGYRIEKVASAVKQKIKRFFDQEYPKER